MIDARNMGMKPTSGMIVSEFVFVFSYVCSATSVV
jgi:hypothetical protein